MNARYPLTSRVRSVRGSLRRHHLRDARKSPEGELSDYSGQRHRVRVHPADNYFINSSSVGCVASAQI